MKKLVIVPGLLALIAASCQDQPQISTPQSSTAAEQAENFRLALKQGQHPAHPEQAGSKPVGIPKAQPAVHRNRTEGGPTIVPPSVSLTLRPGECSPVPQTWFFPGSSTNRA